ncbi:DUF6265 family protein [Arenimonas daejeonensis]|uniref:DUF6265 family protein n=1 Tax=Arenimonas daejeonensis TaxID=370777 RepID=UPI0011BDFC77|nr:DUF6265 family protein [Arenimonas daejeonensis]
MHQSIALGVSILLSASALAAAPAQDLGWLAGDWCGGDAGETIEESWLAPRGGELLGLSRTSKSERMVAFEFLRIVAVDGVPTYLAQPGGRPPTAFTRSAGGDRWVRFENPAHDFPQRIEYRRDGDSLRAEIAGPGDDGKETVIGFDYRRCQD